MRRTFQAWPSNSPAPTPRLYPCIDAVLATANGVFGIVGLFSSDAFASDISLTGLHEDLEGLTWPAQSKSEKALMYQSIAALVWAPVQAVSAVKGLSKVNDCRSFNARLSEEQRRGTQSQAGYEWLDELFPLPDLGVTGLDPVFGVPINQDH